MHASNLTPAAFHDEEAALTHLEAVLWPMARSAPVAARRIASTR
jgi:hypothetical protein